MSTSITSPITEQQARQYRRFVEDAARRGTDLALEQLPLEKNTFQWGVLETGELSKRITQAVVDTTKTLLVNHRMKDLELQVNFLRYYSSAIAMYSAATTLFSGNKELDR